MRTIFLILVTSIASFLPAQANFSPAIHVEVRGAGEPILLIPGFTVPGEVWNPLIDRLVKEYECHSVTLAGFGGRTPIEFPWLPKVNTALLEYIDRQELTNVTVVGHSLGGTIATWLASRENTAIARVILVDALPATGALMFPDFDPDRLAYDSPFNNQQLAMSEAEFELLATNMAGAMSLDSNARTQITQWITEADRTTYVYGYTDYLKLDLREDLKTISVPVSILAADQPFGEAVATQTYRDQYANLPAYDLIFAENSAHFIMLDRPVWFLNQISRILSAR